MLKVLILTEDRYYADGLKELIDEVAAELHAGLVMFLEPQAFGDYRQADMAFSDVPVCTGFRCCPTGFSYHLHIRLPPACLYTGLHDGGLAEDIQPCPGQFTTLLSRRAPLEQVRGMLLRQITELKRLPYHRFRRVVCAGCRLSALSTRECEVLSATGRGESLQRMSGAMGISDKTLSTHRCAMKLKLGGVNSHVLHRFAAWFTALSGEPVPAVNVDDTFPPGRGCGLLPRNKGR